MDESILSHRVKLLDDAVRFRKPERVAFMPSFFMWSPLDAGLNVWEACTNWEKNTAAQRRFYETYKFDVFTMQSGLFCNPPLMLKGVGEGYNIFNIERESIELTDHALMEAGEYDAAMADRHRFIWETLLARKFPKWKGLTVGDLAEPLAEWTRHLNHLAGLAKIAEDLSLPPQGALGVPFAGIEYLVNYLRGMQGTALDIRRQPEKVRAFCEMMDEAYFTPFVEQIRAYDGPRGRSAFDVAGGMLAHNFLSPSQFEKYYWPALKKVIDAAIEKDMTIFLFCEGRIARLHEFFDGYPKGFIGLGLEQDDIYEAREALPNICLAGGMTTHYLAQVTPEESVKRAKTLIDDLGKDGGFVLSPDKMMSYKRDARSENLKAVCDFVSEYTF